VKLVTFEYRGRERIGRLDGRMVDMVEGFSSMLELIRSGARPESLRTVGSVPLSAGELLAPIPEPGQDVICLGLNYEAHVEESSRFKKAVFERPNAAIYFSKRVNKAVAPGEPIQGHLDLDEQLDYEAELAVIIGRDARNVRREAAFDYVFGYTILNDISARSLQGKHKQWYFAKSLDGFTPMGPCIVTEDEFVRPPALSIRSYVNWALRQDSNTDQLIFDIPSIIEELSSGMTLKAGTIISTGTPAGVGMGMQPPCFLKKGDVVRCEIEGIGALENPVS
jgi:2-keto-4-pentenoate hydratase/2-oxohepta-3-ene-1,7-dioic acid hydratase in catechol pathway